MMKIFILIKKDFIFCSSWILIAAALTIFAPMYFVYILDSDELFIEIICLFSGLLGCNVALSRICYIEDNYGTKGLLNAIPVTKIQFVFSRYIEGFLMIVCFTFLTIGSGNYVLGISLHIELIILFIFGGFAFESVYLFLTYRLGSNVAQYAFLGIIGLICIICVIINKLNIAIPQMEFNIEREIILLVIGLALYFISCAMSCKFYKFIY